MANDRHRARVPWLGHVQAITGAHWSIRWLIRLVTLGVAVASYMVIELTSGPVQLATRVALTAIVLIAGAKEAADVVRTVQAYRWDQWGRFAWMRYIALIASVLIVLTVPYMLLVIVYPTLRSTPMTSVALATILTLVVLALTLLALTALSVIVLLLWLPVAIVRSRVQERRRRQYHFPAR